MNATIPAVSTAVSTADRRPAPVGQPRPGYADRPRRSPALAGLYGREARAEIVRSLRMPEFALPTILMPLAFYALFAIVLARPGSGTATYSLATFGVFAALGPAMFGFGAGVGYEREHGVLSLKQISPLPAGAYLCAKLAAAAVFTAAVLLGLYAVAGFGAGVALERGAWATLFALHLACVVPFGLLGLGIGLLLKGAGAVAVTNVAFFVLAVLGGLWIPMFLFPEWLKAIALGLPTFHLAELALGVVGRSAGGEPATHLAVVAAFTALAAAFAAWAWQRVSK